MPRTPRWDERSQSYFAMGCELNSIPNELFTKYRHAKWIHLNNNRIEQIPDDVTCLSHVRGLALSYNKLTRLPQCIGQLKTLERLSVHGNPLTSLPESLTELTSLRSFNCDVIPGMLEEKVRIKDNRDEVIKLWKRIFPHKNGK